VKIAIPEIGGIDENDALTVVLQCVLLELLRKGEDVMATLHRLRLALCAWVGTGRPLVASALFLAHFAAFDVVEAASITFRFDATVTHALSANPFDLPFDYQVGDVISGKLTFEPEAAEPIGANAVEAEQLFGLEFTIDGTTFGTSTYSIRVINDTVILDSDPFLGTVDTMSIRCSSSDPQPCSPGLLSMPGSEPFSITSRLNLVGNGDILDSPTVDTESEIWNSFTLRRNLSLTFGNDAGGSMLLRADVGQFVQDAPEPKSSSVSIFLIACLFTWWALDRSNRRISA
jgi:hypothetical protein